MVLKPLSKAAKTGAKSFVPIRVYQAQETRSLRHGGVRKDPIRWIQSGINSPISVIDQGLQACLLLS
jgi:hypothetical protein